jgi:hypothetical protein
MWRWRSVRKNAASEVQRLETDNRSFTPASEEQWRVASMEF